MAGHIPPLALAYAKAAQQAGDVEAAGRALLEALGPIDPPGVWYDVGAGGLALVVTAGWTPNRSPGDFLAVVPRGA